MLSNFFWFVYLVVCLRQLNSMYATVDQTYAALVTPPEDTNMLIMPIVRTVRNISLGSTLCNTSAIRYIWFDSIGELLGLIVGHTVELYS